MREEDKSQKHKPKIGVFTVLVVAAVVLLAAALVALVKDVQEKAGRVVFGTNLSGLAKALRVYVNDDPHRILPGDNWCDVLVGLDFCTPKQFVCRELGAIEGESSVAINKYAAGRSFNELPGDMVLLFETDFGRERGRRKGLVKERAFYKLAPCMDANTRVYRNRWNQVGGPEILSVHYGHWHDEKACNVAFVDTSVRVVKAADLPNLKWKPDPNDK